MTDNQWPGLERLRDDLQRPAGGWTVGMLTLTAWALSPALLLVAPKWVATAAAITAMVANLIWGIHGYYPASLVR